MRKSDPNARRFPATIATAAVVALAAACGGSQTTPTPTPSGIATVLPPETASPSPSPTASPSPSPTAAPTTFGPVSVSLEKVVAGLPRPIGIANAGDDRLFIVDQDGRIVIVEGGKVTGTFLDIRSRVSKNGGERGLLGLAFHPEYASNGRFFVRYTVTTGDIRISEFHVSSDPNKADPASEKVLLTIRHRSFPNHNGGVIAFGPDGYLYIGTGDGGSGGDPYNFGQNLGVQVGKMLRIDVDHQDTGLAYAIPADNPFVGQSGKLGEIWAYGLRNPYSFSFDRATGDLWIADVGQDTWEEIDRATVANGLGRGGNYGWSVMEGDHCFKPAKGCDTSGKVRPIAEYNHGRSDSTGCAVIGASVYRGTAHPELVGRYFFGDDCSGRIWDLQADGPDAQTPQQVLDTSLRIMGWGEGADGEIYLVALNGILYHLV
jgi:glucose/arabinose dehydrogenase